MPSAIFVIRANDQKTLPYKGKVTVGQSTVEEITIAADTTEDGPSIEMNLNPGFHTVTVLINGQKFDCYTNFDGKGRKNLEWHGHLFETDKVAVSVYGLTNTEGTVTVHY